MKRKNIAKGATLILLISALFISCEGWSVADDIITNSTSVTDNYYTVTVCVDDVSVQLKMATVPDPETIADVSTAIKAVTGKTLAGWYCEETGALFDDWNKTLTEDLTVHAAWALTSDNMNDSFTNGGYYALTEDVTVVFSATVNVASDLTVDLNGKTLAISQPDSYYTFLHIEGTSVSTKPSVSILNGNLTISQQNAGDSSATINVISVAMAELTLDDVTLSVTNGSGIFAKDGGTLNINSSTVNTTGGYYGIGTNNLKSAGDNSIYINITDSQISVIGCGDGDATGICLNRDYPAECTILTIKNSTIEAGRQAVMVRGGTANISDSTLTTTGLFSETTDRDTAWTSGNEVIYATVALGCNSSGDNGSSGDSINIPYTADTNVTFSNVTFGEKAKYVIGVGAVKNSSCTPKVTITIDEEQVDLITVTRLDSGASVTVNGASVTAVTTTS